MEAKVKVNIFGSEYSILGDAEPEYIQKLAEYVNDRMVEIGKNVISANTAQIAILTVLNIVDEYFQVKGMKSDVNGEMEQKTKSMITMLDEGLIGDIFEASDAIRN